MNYVDGRRTLLDCTLRDGGYVNNWEFSNEISLNIINGLYYAGIKNIEIGIMGMKSISGRQTKFTCFSDMEPLLKNRKSDCRYFVMINQAEIEYFDIPQCSEKTVDCIRLAFFKKEWKSSIAYAYSLIQKGYQVFLQGMATFMYTDVELFELIEAVNLLKPAAFYIVDSFGTMYNDDIKSMSQYVGKYLDADILFGLHAHNNIQMAYSNTIAFFNTNQNRELIADCSIFGMGRGAGNVPTELLIKYINEKFNYNYCIEKIIQTFDDYIKPIFKNSYWGYTMENYLTASKNINPSYAWYLGTKGIVSLRDFNEILKKIPENIRYNLSVKVANEAIEEYQREKGE